MNVYLLLGLVSVVVAEGYNYRGKYSGRCGEDGIYYMDTQSFVLCAGKNAYQQPCAPGTQNSAYQYYDQGGYYGSGDFCNINLVDHGYNGGKHYHQYKPTGYQDNKHKSYQGYSASSYGNPQPAATGYPGYAEVGEVHYHHHHDYDGAGYGDGSYHGNQGGYGNKYEKRTQRGRTYTRNGYSDHESSFRHRHSRH